MIWTLVIGRAQAIIFKRSKIFPYLTFYKRFPPSTKGATKSEKVTATNGSKPNSLEAIKISVFYSDLANELKKSKKANYFDYLIVMADPTVLYIFLENLDPISKASIIGVLPKDMFSYSFSELSMENHKLILSWSLDSELGVS